MTWFSSTACSASRARESSVTHKSAITDHALEENHVIDWDKAKMVDRKLTTDSHEVSLFATVLWTDEIL